MTDGRCTALWRNAEAIAQWSRETGSAGEARAFDYVAAQLEQIGATVTRTVVPAFVSLPRGAELTVDGRAVPALTHAMAAPTPDAGVEGELVAATVEPSAWGGRIVVFDGLALAGSVRRAQHAGALAALFLSNDRIAHEMIVSSVWGSPEPDDLGELPQIPAATIGGESAESLRAIVRSRSLARARLIARVDTGWREIPLLTAEIRALEARGSQFVLLSGHVDSWHLGAMDNAGANAVMLDVARAARAVRERLHRHVRLAFWSGHSHARYAGSAAWVDRHWDELERDCVVHLNIDSVGGRGASVLTQAPSMAATHRVGTEAVAAVVGQSLARERFPRAGDQSLANIGVPALFLTLSEQPADGPERLLDGSALVKSVGGQETGGLGWWWHTPEDTLDKLDPHALARDAEVYRRAVLAFACDPLLPLDVAAEATDLDEHLRTLAVACAGRFELADVLERSGRLVKRAHGAMTRAARLREDAGDADGLLRVNRALAAAVRPLVRLGYVERDCFAHDAVSARPPVPLLSVPLRELLATAPGSDAAYAWEVLLTRRRNRVLAELLAAHDALAPVTESGER